MLNLDRGLIIEGYALARHCLENVAQGIALLRDAKDAESWMRSNEFKPWKIRDKLGGSPDVKPEYDQLSKLAHPNFSASRMHSLEVPPTGFAIWYGGSYKPKTVAQGYILLTRTAELYLRELFAHYRGQLDLVTWPLYFELIRQRLSELIQWADSLPEDDIENVAFMRTQPGEQPIEQAVSDEAMAHMRRQSQKAFGYGGPDHVMAALEQSDASLEQSDTEFAPE